MPGKRSISLDLLRLTRGYDGLTEAMGRVLADAAALCLTECGHTSGVQHTVTGALKARCLLHFPAVTPQIANTFADPDEATEWGACGIAIAVVAEMTEYTVVKRSVKGTGFDYWLGIENEPLFQRAARLEVSGIRHGDSSKLRARVKEKVEQTKRSDGTYPAFVVVTEFSTPTTHVVKR